MLIDKVLELPSVQIKGEYPHGEIVKWLNNFPLMKLMCRHYISEATI